jgi:hypothetical protein
VKKKVPGLTFPNEQSRKPSLFWDGELLSKKIRDWVEEDDRKLKLLCQHHSIQDGPHMFYQLALVLARELYPEPRRRGNKTKWTWLNQGALVVEVERRVRPGDPSHGVDWACGQLAKREPWNTFLSKNKKDHPDPGEALRRAYYNFKDDRWANVSRAVFKFHQLKSTIEEWDRDVEDFVKNPHLN